MLITSLSLEHGNYAKNAHVINGKWYQRCTAHIPNVTWRACFHCAAFTRPLIVALLHSYSPRTSQFQNKKITDPPKKSSIMAADYALNTSVDSQLSGGISQCFTNILYLPSYSVALKLLVEWNLLSINANFAARRARRLLRAEAKFCAYIVWQERRGKAVETSMSRAKFQKKWPT